MKNIILCVLTSGILMATASAAPRIVLDTVVTEYLYPEGADYPSGKKQLAHSHIVTDSGKRSVTRTGRFEFATTPTLKDNGKIELMQIYTRLEGKGSPRTYKPITRTVPLGSTPECAYGPIFFSTKVSLAK